jgi:hypothetical protein
MYEVRDVSKLFAHQGCTQDAHPYKGVFAVEHDLADF